MHDGVAVIIAILVGLVILIFLISPEHESAADGWVGASRSSMAGLPFVTDQVSAIAQSYADTVVRPQLTALPRSVAGSLTGDVLLATTSAASMPVVGTIPASQLTLDQQGAMDAFVTTAPSIVGAGSNIQLPDTFDVRDKWPGLIGEPLDQLTCGSCWSFGVSAVLSDRIRIHSKRGTNEVSLVLNRDNLASTVYEETVTSNTGEPLLTNKISYRGDNNYLDALSPYFFAGCDVCGYSFNLDPEISTIFTSRGLCANCCAGGVIQYAFIFALLNGIIAMSCGGSIVSYACTTQIGCPVFRPKGIYRVNPYTTEINDPTTADPSILEANDRAIMQEVYTNGPVAASYYNYSNLADWDTRYVYDNAQGDRGGHTISIMGWGVGPDPSGNQVPYWLIRNSWSQEWGDRGYFRMKRQNFCRISQDVWGCDVFQVYDTTPIPPTSNPFDSQAATACSSPPTYSVVS